MACLISWYHMGPNAQANARAKDVWWMRHGIEPAEIGIGKPSALDSLGWRAKQRNVVVDQDY